MEFYLPPATARLFDGPVLWQHSATQMRTLLSLLALAFLLPARIHAAITVGPGGSGIISFNSLPPASDWTTRSLAGTELTFTTAAALDAAVQTNRAAAITNTLLDGLGAVPPGQNTLASWSGGGTSALWTRPAANSATLLMATLQNSTGEDQTVAVISYTLSQSGTTPTEQAPAHEVFYSLTGEAGTWVKIPALSGGAPGARSATVSLNGVWTNGATLFILWADDNTTGGVDRGYALDDVTFAGRPPLTLEVIPDLIAEVLRPVFIRAAVSNAAPGARFTYSLEAGAPAAARLHPTNGLFLWKPARSDANTTNQITLRATDVAAPSSSATRTFVVVVKDYVELSLGGVVLLGGQRTNVLLESTASAPLTNLQLTLLLPTNRLTLPVVENLVATLATVAADDSQPGRVVLNFSALPGQWIVGTQILARLSFTAAPEPASAFVPLLLETVSAARATPGLAPSFLLNHGRAVILNREPLVEALTASNTRTLVLYGHPGSNYVVETAASVTGPWQSRPNGTHPALFTTFDISNGTNVATLFYRAREISAPAPPTLAPGPSGPVQKSAPLKKLKKMKKKKLPPSRLKKPALTP